MNKKIVFSIVILIIVIITGTVFFNFWRNGKMIPSAEEAKKVSEVKKADQSDQAAKSDEDIDAIEKDLDSINSEDFGENSLSDSELGL